MKLEQEGNMVLLCFFLLFYNISFSQSKKQIIASLSSRVDSLLLVNQDLSLKNIAIETDLRLANNHVNSVNNELKTTNIKLNQSSIQILQLEKELSKYKNANNIESVSLIKNQILSNIDTELTLKQIVLSDSNTVLSEYFNVGTKWLNKVYSKNSSGVVVVKTYSIESNIEKLVKSLTIQKDDDFNFKIYLNNELIFIIPNHKNGMDLHLKSDSISSSVLCGINPNINFQSAKLNLYFEEDVNLNKYFAKENWDLFFDGNIYAYFSIVKGMFAIDFYKDCGKKNTFYFN